MNSLLARETQTQWPINFPRQQREQRFKKYDFAAEPPANWHRNYTNFVSRYVQNFCDVIAYEEWPLRWRPDRHAAVRFWSRDCNVRLNRRVMNACQLVGAFDH